MPENRTGPPPRQVNSPEATLSHKNHHQYYYMYVQVQC